MRQQKISVYVKPLKDKNLMSHKQKRYMQAQDSLQAGYAKCFLILQRCLHLPKLDLNIQTSKNLVGPVKVKHQRKGSASPEGHREPQEDLRLAHEEIFPGGKECANTQKMLDVVVLTSKSMFSQSSLVQLVLKAQWSQSSTLWTRRADLMSSSCLWQTSNTPAAK